MISIGKLEDLMVGDVRSKKNNKKEDKAVQEVVVEVVVVEVVEVALHPKSQGLDNE